MRKHILQVVHTYEDGSYNVIETLFDKPYQVDAEMRRHKKQPHPNAACEMFRVDDFTIEGGEDDHARLAA